MIMQRLQASVRFRHASNLSDKICISKHFILFLPDTKEPKEGGQYRGIALLKITWKLIWKIVDCRIRQHVEFHDAIHGVWAKLGAN